MRYRVTVEELTPAADGIGDDSKTIVEFAGPGEMLARFAPGAVAEVLGAERAAVTVVMPADRPTSPLPADVESPLAEPLPRAEQVPAEQVAEADKPKRKRRTKAEIAADEAAQAAGFRDAAHQAEAQAAATGEGPTGGGDADLTAAASATEQAPEVAAAEAMQQHANASAAEAGYMTPYGPVVAESPAPVPVEQAPPAAAPASAPSTPPAGEPWNPFAR